MRLHLLAAVFMLSLTILGPALAQQTPTQDPQAVNLATQAYSALTGGTSLHDVSFTGTERRIAGSSDVTEPVTLRALGTDNARIDRAQSSTFEIRSNGSGSPAGAWSGSDGASHQMSLHNCWTDAAWFFPAFSSAFSTTQPVQLTYIGAESWNGASVQHIRITKLITDPSGKTNTKTLALITKLSQMELYLDPQSLLPVATSFAQHPDDNAGLDIPVVITYSDYRAMNGLRVPFHIQKYVQNSLTIDLVISGATFNSGLTSSSFQVQ
jgi:hypothetical protein